MVSTKKNIETTLPINIVLIEQLGQIVELLFNLPQGSYRKKCHRLIREDILTTHQVVCAALTTIREKFLIADKKSATRVKRGDPWSELLHHLEIKCAGSSDPHARTVADLIQMNRDSGLDHRTDLGIPKALRKVNDIYNFGEVI